MDPGSYGIAHDDLPPFEQGRIDFATWFPPQAPGAAPKPLELEIGSGKGTFLVNQALATPEINYIGIEWARAYWLYASDRARRNDATNVRVVRTDAAAFVRQYCADNCFRQVHIYFPDPWPKARHNKRRILQEPFYRELHRVLQAQGLIRIATDHADYFEWMNSHLIPVVDLFEKLPFESPASAGQGELVGSNFERKYRREGRPFHSMILRRKP
jgi:tRNA (guanine-N7-)-methyltransferase